MEPRQVTKMRRRSEHKSLERVERLLRAQPAAALAPDFKRQIMARISRLPEPAAMRRGLRPAAALALLSQLSAGERIGLGLVLLGAAALCLPGALDLFNLLEWELADYSLSLSLGETAISASLASVCAIGTGLVALMAAGLISTRQQLLGA